MKLSEPMTRCVWLRGLGLVDEQIIMEGIY